VHIHLREEPPAIQRGLIRFRTEQSSEKLEQTGTPLFGSRNVDFFLQKCRPARFQLRQIFST